MPTPEPQPKPAKRGRPRVKGATRNNPQITIRLIQGLKTEFAQLAARANPGLRHPVQTEALRAIERHLHPSPGTVAYDRVVRAIRAAGLGEVGELAIQRLSDLDVAQLAATMLSQAALKSEVGGYALHRITEELGKL